MKPGGKDTKTRGGKTSHRYRKREQKGEEAVKRTELPRQSQEVFTEKP